MSLSRIFGSRSLRLPLLVATVIATVATSRSEGWTLSDEAEIGLETLAPGESAEVKASYDASHLVTVDVRFEDFTAAPGRIRVERLTPCGDEPATPSSVELEDGHWRPSGSDRDYEQHADFRFRATCATDANIRTKGEAAIKVTNLSEASVGFRWTFDAVIGGGDGDSDVPKGAFVNVEVVR